MFFSENHFVKNIALKKTFYFFRKTILWKILPKKRLFTFFRKLFCEKFCSKWGFLFFFRKLFCEKYRSKEASFKVIMPKSSVCSKMALFWPVIGRTLPYSIQLVLFEIKLIVVKFFTSSAGKKWNALSFNTNLENDNRSIRRIYQWHR